MKRGDVVQIYQCEEWYNSGGIGVILEKDPNYDHYRICDFRTFDFYTGNPMEESAIEYVKAENLNLLDFVKPKVSDPLWKTNIKGLAFLVVSLGILFNIAVVI